MYKLRPYQQDAVDATIAHFRVDKSPAVIVLPTGAGKSLVIAELARVAKGRVLILAHVRELVEQNHNKFLSLGIDAGIYSAGLNRKEKDNKIIFGSIQSIVRADEDFFQSFSLLIIDECHRISMEGDTQYFQVITKLREKNNDICLLGLTATPYRLGLGWIYQFNSFKKILRTNKDRFFIKCIYELSLSFMIKNNYLTPPIKIDSPVACYDFSSLKLNGGKFVLSEVEGILKDQKRITPVIIQNIISMSQDRLGIMIFTSSVRHAEEILRCLPPFVSAMVVGDTEGSERDEIINAFKEQKIKYLVNVSVLTTGFDAPHVDLIAILRPTESVSLYQQIVGRGLRLSPKKTDCLILDFTGQGHNIFSPEIEDERPTSDSVTVEITCPVCGLINNFWGLLDDTGELVEHFGRKCKGATEDPLTHRIIECGFLFRFKRCDQCSHENDIAARVCKSCQHLLVDNDKKLKEAMSLKDAHVMRVETMLFHHGADKSGNSRLEVTYFDVDVESLKEYFYLSTPENLKAFYFNFTRMHNRIPETEIRIANIEDVLKNKEKFRKPMFVIARKSSYFWEVREKVF
jgi:DNA repair protein RadD